VDSPPGVYDWCPAARRTDPSAHSLPPSPRRSCFPHPPPPTSRSTAATGPRPVDGSYWPTADELRRDLQDIGYQFRYDGSSRAFEPEFRPELPGIWVLTEPVVIEEGAPEETGFDPFTLGIVDMAGLPAQVVFSTASIDDGDGELDQIASVLMELAGRLPEGNGLDSAVWYMSNTWLPPGTEGRVDLPCLIAEFDDGATVVWSGGDGEGLTSFFGTLSHFDGTSAEVEQCRALQAQGATTGQAGPEVGPDPDAPDFTVAPDEAVALIEAGEHTVIDVRTPAEFEQAHVVGAISIDVEAPDFAERIAELDPETPYLLYCRTGRRSALAAQQMSEAGFTDLADAGGLVDLARAGAPVE
jgi:rhodanese-related sulfurtransferase